MSKFRKMDFKLDKHEQVRAYAMIQREIQDFPIHTISVLEKNFKDEDMRLIVISAFKKVKA